MHGRHQQQQGQGQGAAVAPKGCVTYGFRQQGAIAIPCPVDRFVHVERLIDQDLHGAHHLVDLDAAAAHHHQSQIHLHLPRFADCFRA
uniref:Uncharacterized protein n=1 Tax=Oryza brachyantha TaxID=4533 RepID=J3N410_ORYBR